MILTFRCVELHLHEQIYQLELFTMKRMETVMQRVRLYQRLVGASKHLALSRLHLFLPPPP